MIDKQITLMRIIEKSPYSWLGKPKKKQKKTLMRNNRQNLHAHHDLKRRRHKGSKGFYLKLKEEFHTRIEEWGWTKRKHWKVERTKKIYTKLRILQCSSSSAIVVWFTFVDTQNFCCRLNPKTLSQKKRGKLCFIFLTKKTRTNLWWFVCAQIRVEILCDKKHEQKLTDVSLTWYFSPKPLQALLLWGS